MLTEQEVKLARDITGALDCQSKASLVVSFSNDNNVRMLIAGDAKSVNWLREQFLKESQRLLKGVINEEV